MANEWINQTRLNWPPETMISEIVKLGCDLIPVGSSGNHTDSKEWRISFVRAERCLIRSLNAAQLKTIVLLKVIFKHRMFGDGFHDTISSYVAKCSFFWISMFTQNKKFFLEERELSTLLHERMQCFAWKASWE